MKKIKIFLTLILGIGTISLGAKGCLGLNETNVTGSSAPLPSAVSSLNVISISYSEIKLTWQDNSNNEDGFLIDRSVGNTESFTSLPAVGPNITVYTDTALSEVTTYYYRIRAFNANGYSMYSNIVSATTTVRPPNWTLKLSNNKPSGRNGHTITYDSNRNKVVLFGGDTYPNEWSNETWEWDGANWTLITLTNKPSARDYHAVAYDPARAKVVLFGGQAIIETTTIISGTPITTTTTGRSNETWEWDGMNWGIKSPANEPSARYGHAMVYDSFRNEVILFGGESNSGYSDETWSWNGTNWTLKLPANKPSARAWHTMAYDSARDKIVLFGGAFPYNYETWEWDGIDWVQKTPVNRPSSPNCSAMLYDSARGKVVLFGGETTANGLMSTETWEWDGINWTLVLPNNKPTGVKNHAMTYDTFLQKIILFGGWTGGLNSDETWEYGY